MPKTIIIFTSLAFTLAACEQHDSMMMDDSKSGDAMMMSDDDSMMSDSMMSDGDAMMADG